MTLPPEDKLTDDWSDLSRAWTEGSADDRPDNRLIRQLRRRDRLARLNFLSEIAGALFVLGAIGWAMLVKGLPWPHGGAAIAFAAFAVAMTLWSRRGDLGLLTDTPEAALRSAIGQARIGVRWAIAGMAISVAAMAFLGLITQITPHSGGPLNPLAVGGQVALLICIGFYARHAHRCRRRMAGHEAALAALSAPLDPPPWGRGTA